MTTGTTTSSTPIWDAHCDKIEKLVESHDFVGKLLIQAIKRDNDEEQENDNLQNEQKDVTQDQIDNELRYIYFDEARLKTFQQLESFADPEDGMWNTSTGNYTIEMIEPTVKKIMRKKSIPDRFNHLCAITYSLGHYSFWMHDNELYGEGDLLDESILLLARTWKKLLKKCNTELGIDEYTRAGVETVLDKFSDEVEQTHCINVEFIWN